ncbi:transforming growth factor beta regulator 1 [Anopheles nili]|uniref:transforming growth factor beta regulator 1 n=1 Tax=Anopheles nili TaxID=185578 RepID=UPI00237BAA10|nr:transforming growth factor beta regulator 1 [Anopheles nili]
MQSTSCEPSAAGDDVNAKFRHKYRRLKRYMKDLVFENAALCDHIAQVQEKISQRNEERRFMLKKLLDHENELETQLGRPCSKLNELIANSLPPKRQYKKREKNPTANGAANTSASAEGQDTHDTQETVVDCVAENGLAEESNSLEKHAPTDRNGEKNGHRVGKKRGPPGGTGTGGAKVRRKGRLGGSSVPSGKKGIQSIALDQSGHPTYPIVVGGFTILNLGEIAPERSAYHTECTIYPIGYTATRPYGHYKDPEKRCIYTCRVLDDGERPRFEIVPESPDPTAPVAGEAKEPEPLDTEECVISGTTIDGCHAELLQKINAALNVPAIDAQPSGDWFFGLAHPTISSLIQNFPSAKLCANYKGAKKENYANTDKENDPTLNYEALVRHITISTYRTVPEIKEEPPDELFDHSDGGNSFSLSV